MLLTVSVFDHRLWRVPGSASKCEKHAVNDMTCGKLSTASGEAPTMMRSAEHHLMTRMHHMISTEAYMIK